MNGAVERLRTVVQANCHVTDARHARNMTLCIYLLEMRELFRWERGAALGSSLPRADVGAWIAEREALWETLEGADYQPLPLDGGEVDPYDIDAVNRAVAPYGLVYGAGVGRFGKPQFFLGVLEREESRDGMRVLVAGRELARDLSAAPAAMRGDTVSIRFESLLRVLWERVEGWAQKRHEGALKAALDAYGYEFGSAAAIERMAAAEVETLILHELGERDAGRVLGPRWEDMLASLTRRRTEIFVRAVRDLLADCLVTLPALLERNAAASLHFWFASFDGMRQMLFPQMATAYALWRNGDGGRALRAAIDAGVPHWQRIAAQVLELDASGSQCAEEAIEALSSAGTTPL